jgi:hypothetical protein
MSRRLPVLGSIGVYLASRPDGWFLVNGSGEQALPFRILDENGRAYLATLLGCSSVHDLGDAIALTH